MKENQESRPVRVPLALPADLLERVERWRSEAAAARPLVPLSRNSALLLLLERGLAAGGGE